MIGRWLHRRFRCRCDLLEQRADGLWFVCATCGRAVRCGLGHDEQAERLRARMAAARDAMRQDAERREADRKYAEWRNQTSTPVLQMRRRQ